MSNVEVFKTSKWLAAFFCLFSLAASKETQINLEDIERDNLTNENTGELQQQIPQLLYNPQPQRGPGTLQNLPPRQYYATATAPPPPAPQSAPQFAPATPPQQSVGPHQFAPDARQFPPPPPLQVQFPSRIPQQQLITAPAHQQFLQYLAQPRISLDSNGHGQQQYQYQYVPDNTNNFIQDPYIQQYFAQSSPQQYIYFQQEAQPSHNVPIQTNPENLGGIQYVQYLDPNTEILSNPQTHAQLQNPHHYKSSHNLAGLIQKHAHTNTLPLNYRQPAPQTYRPQGQAQPLLNQNVYVIPQVVQPANSNLQPVYQQQVQPPRSQPQVLGQQRYLVPGITFVNRQQPVRQQYFSQQPIRQQLIRQQPIRQQPVFRQEAQQSITNVVYEKRQPKSLLDSYVPSVLQIQYYKQLQEQQRANGLRAEGKLTENIIGKSDVQKNLPNLPVREPAKEPVYEYQYQ